MNTITRRAATVTAALMLAGVLAACGEDDPTETDQATTVATQDEVGDGAAFGPMDVCIDLTNAGLGFGVTEMPADEACRWQQGISPDDFAIMYDESSSEAERQAAATRMQEAADGIVEYADEALED